ANLDFGFGGFWEGGRGLGGKGEACFSPLEAGGAGTGKEEKPQTQNLRLKGFVQGPLIRGLLITWEGELQPPPQQWVNAEEKKIAEEFFDEVCKWASEVRGEILVYHDGYFQKDKQLFNSIKNSTFDNLILPPVLKQQIQNDFQQFFNSSELYEQYGIPWK